MEEDVTPAVSAVDRPDSSAHVPDAMGAKLPPGEQGRVFFEGGRRHERHPKERHWAGRATGVG